MNKWLLTFLYILVFVLLREWLLPVVELTETGHLSLFLIFIGLAFLLALIGVKWWLSIPLKLIYIFWAVHYIYSGLMPAGKNPMKLVLGDIASNIPIIIGGDWESISNPLRTILFFLLLWMGTYLIRYWIEVRKSIFLFYFMTIIFIAIMDAFSMYSAEGSILRVMVVGLILLGLLTIPRLIGKHDTSISPKTFIAIIMPLFLVVMVGSILTTVLPKQEAVWGDSVPFFKTIIDEVVNDEAHEGVSKSGYDPDDTQLGGPFLVDESLVFEASVDKKQYWKIETKDTYTSKGWEQSKSRKRNPIYPAGAVMQEFEVTKNVEFAKSKSTQLTMTEKFPFIIYPYGMTTVFTDEDVSILNIVDAGQYRTDVKNKERILDAYEIEYTEHRYSLKALRKTKMSSFQSTDDFSEYLQLPETLPDRVAELAESITATNESVYDKAKAIERYYGSAGFVYDQTNVAVPEENEDYVDQFLFETQVGYCDNFSTSMVVMLRTLGIPARWVKGFAPGEVARNDEGERVYQVTNEEAHSWVEAYMPGIGWMPFEPTIGFNGLTSIDYDIEVDRNDPGVSEVPKKEREKVAQNARENVDKERLTFNEMWGTANTVLEESVVWILMTGTVLLIIGWVGYRKRKKWLPKVVVRFHQSDGGDWVVYSKQYKSLLHQLERLGLQRASGETLSAYAVRVDNHFGGNLMKKLTIAYEEGIYGENRESQDWQRLQEMWKDLINKTSN